MADPEFLEIQRIHMGVTAVIRKHKLNTQVLDEINAVFGRANPTMRVTTETAVKPIASRVKNVYTTNVPYRQGYSYITVVGADGVDDGQKFWLVLVPSVDAARCRTRIREVVRQHGIRGLLSNPCGGELLQFPTLGAEMPTATAAKHPGIYLYKRFGNNGQPTVCVFHPKR